MRLLRRHGCVWLPWLISWLSSADCFHVPTMSHHRPHHAPSCVIRASTDGDNRPTGSNGVERDDDTNPDAEVEDLNADFEAGVAFGKDIISRFVSPRVDDPGLPYADSLVCISGSLFVASLAITGFLPNPTWLQPTSIVPAWRSLPYILPALSHGAALAACWMLGAFSSAAFEREAFMGTWREAVSRTWRGGAFATGILVLSTQIVTAATLTQRGIDPTIPSAEADYEVRKKALVLHPLLAYNLSLRDAFGYRIAPSQVLTRAFEVICDVTVQAVGLTAFRLFRWSDAQR